MVNVLDYESIEFPVSRKDYSNIEQNINNWINVFSYGNDSIYPVYVSNEKFENCIDLLLIADEKKSQYVYNSDFNRFIYNRTKSKTKK